MRIVIVVRKNCNFQTWDCSDIEVGEDVGDCDADVIVGRFRCPGINLEVKRHTGF